MRRFTLRDLFWLTLVVGRAVAWWVGSGAAGRTSRCACAACGGTDCCG